MNISNNYVVVERILKPEQEGFQTVEVQDDYVYTGKVIRVPDQPIYMGNESVKPGDEVIFAKYSPDTHEIELEGKKVKFVKSDDLLAVL